MSMPTPSLLTRLTDPFRRRAEYRRITELELSRLCALSLRGNWGPDGDALVVAYPAIARSVYLDVAASRRRLTEFLTEPPADALERALAQVTYRNAYRDAR